MEYELSEDSDDTLIHHQEAGMGSTTKKYVIACTIFANLNHVLLVYGGKTSDLIGRKWTMALAARLSNWFSHNGSCAFEISPSVARGFLITFPEFFINVGILLGYVSNYAFSGLSMHLNWRIMLVVGIWPSVFIGIALFVILESPRWLVEERLTEIQLAAGIGNADKGEKKAVWRELLFPSPSVRQMLVSGLGIQFFQRITVIDAAVYYSPEIFKDAGIDSNSTLLTATVTVGVSKTVFILFATFLLDKLGRKPLLYVSTIGITVCLSTLAFSLALLGKGQFEIALAILGVCGSVAFFSMGMDPIVWVVTSEIFPLRLRAQGTALGIKITVAGTFIFSTLSALSVLFVDTSVPETKGKSLEHIGLLFQDQREQLKSKKETADAELLVQNALVIDRSLAKVVFFLHIRAFKLIHLEIQGMQTNLGMAIFFAIHGVSRRSPPQEWKFQEYSSPWSRDGESAFSTSGRVISPHRSKLRPNTIQALMCLQDWLKKDLKGSDNNRNFSNLFEELEENDNKDDESEVNFKQ
ncbi:hypothetical protein SLEP1_g44845 [Rubroshorea leprosula]|uniref:Major facilitator superfamily (MFS) profile domain-containing protein n=1 Tax=Rubroshorea leprosula TaxID=152421 RepID=A0AAV5LHV3_9ROSI|nr:hypothetical protein SLEP1_g44845 [Rubroshorea leprosula]